MRKLCLILALFLLLSGCGTKEASLPEGYRPAYEQTTLPLEDDLILHLRSNGNIIVGATYNYQDSGNLYLLEPGASSVSTKMISDFHGLRYYDLLAVDGDNGIWIGGTWEDDTYAALRLDAQGEELLSIEFEPGVPDHGITSLGWDESHYYIIVTLWQNQDGAIVFDSQLRVYDLEGQEVFRRSINDYCLDTAGYLPQEEDWLEDLEGREGDILLEMLYPDGPVNEVGLIQLQDGSAGMLISRKSPTEAECYGIICPFEADFSITPTMCYPVDTADNGRLYSYFPSGDPDYDLLVNGKTGIYGINLAKQTQTLLYTWDQRQFSLGQLSPLCPGMSDSTYYGPKGTLGFYSWQNEGYVIEVLSPKS